MTLLLEINGKLVCQKCKHNVRSTVEKCPFCGARFENVYTNNFQYNQAKYMQKRMQVYNETTEKLKTYGFGLWVILLVVLIITIINSLLCLFVYNNFTIDLFFLIGIIVPVLYTIFFLYLI